MDNRTKHQANFSMDCSCEDVVEEAVKFFMKLKHGWKVMVNLPQIGKTSSIETVEGKEVVIINLPKTGEASFIRTPLAGPAKLITALLSIFFSFIGAMIAGFNTISIVLMVLAVVIAVFLMRWGMRSPRSQIISFSAKSYLGRTMATKVKESVECVMSEVSVEFPEDAREVAEFAILRIRTSSVAIAPTPVEAPVEALVEETQEHVLITA